MDTTAAMTAPTMLVNSIECATAPISAFEVSSTHQHVAFGDENGCFHLYSTRSRDGGPPPPFNNYSKETTFADVVYTYICSWFYE